MAHRTMLLSHYLWLLLCYAQHGRSDLITKPITNLVKEELEESLPIEVGTDTRSGCTCRATSRFKVVVCFGNYACKSFPKVSVPGDTLKIVTTAIYGIFKGDLEKLNHLNTLEIEANHKLRWLQPGIFANASKMHRLSISYNTRLVSLDRNTFEGLTNLKHLSLVNNGFTSITQLMFALKPTILPNMRILDLFKNSFDKIPEHAFDPLKNSKLAKLDIQLCRIEDIHPNSFLPLEMLRELNINKNDLNSSVIEKFLEAMYLNNIQLTKLDLSEMGFRKKVPKALLSLIAKTTIKRLVLSENHFEAINDNFFPKMVNIESLDLRSVNAFTISPDAFNPMKFPKLKILLLGGNNLPGIHSKHLSNQLLVLDLSCNKDDSVNPTYYVIDKDSFIFSKELKILNLSYNRIKAVHNYTFKGLKKLSVLSIENASIFHIEDGSFRFTKHLKMLNLANNPLTANNKNLSRRQFDGLKELRVLILNSCGIEFLSDEDNIFASMPNITHLILKDNEIHNVSAKLFSPMKFLQVLDLSGNYLMTWWQPIFVTSGIAPYKLYLKHNEISHFSIGMVKDIDYLLSKGGNAVKIDFFGNAFSCDCNDMYDAYEWIRWNGSSSLVKYIENSFIQCNSPDLWENRRVTEYLSTLNNSNCALLLKSSKSIHFWLTISVIFLVTFFTLVIVIRRNKSCVKYWLFITKLAISRRIIRSSLKAKLVTSVKYKYDAFISYCYEDSDFIAQMIEQLEHNPPYLKLCIYERDFQIGSIISESILTGINESKFIILVISNNFAKSNWCQWETQLAEYHRLFSEDGSAHDPLILIRFSNINPKLVLSPTLKYLLKTKVYHVWNEVDTNDFWSKLRNVIVK